MMAINVDVPPVSDEQAALALMFHHLRLAAAYFEATPSKIADVPEGFSAPAMFAWIEAMEDQDPQEDE